MSRVTHDTFTLERTFKATPARVWEAIANPDVKAKWFVGPAGWKLVERTSDIRVGGRERVAGAFPNGFTSVFDATYHDIVEGERLVYVYEMTVNGKKISTSLATFEVVADGATTRLVLTEHGAFYDDDEARRTYAPQGHALSRKTGTEGLLDQIAQLLAS